MSFTKAEIEYLMSNLTGRMATVTPGGQPQVRPTSYIYNAEHGTIDVGGYHMKDTQKYRNVVAGSAVAIVIDETLSYEPWEVKGIEIRGDASVLSDQKPYLPGFSGDIVRIRPRRILSWNVDPDHDGMFARDVP
jgi:pyridoxamine 5'-phosphate oxidase family protein